MPSQKLVYGYRAYVPFFYLSLLWSHANASFLYNYQLPAILRPLLNSIEPVIDIIVQISLPSENWRRRIPCNLSNTLDFFDRSKGPFYISSQHFIVMVPDNFQGYNDRHSVESWTLWRDTQDIPIGNIYRDKCQWDKMFRTSLQRSYEWQDAIPPEHNLTMYQQQPRYHEC